MEPDTTTLDDAMLLEPPVSVLRGWIAISLGVFLVATCGIVVAGYPALEIILIDSGAFHYLCEGTEPCEAQNLRLALMFILAISSLNCCLFFIGPLLNYLGPRNLGMIGACILILGDLLIAFGDEDTMYFYQWGYLAGYPLLGIAGSIVLFCILHLANIFQQHRGKVITVFIATGESAAIVFLLFKLMYDHLGLSLKQLFLIHIIFPGMFFVYCIFFEPDRTYKPPQFGDIKEYYYSRKMPIIRQFKSPQFILFSIWGCISLTANYFYLTNIKDELYWRTGDTAFTTLGQELVTIFFGHFYHYHCSNYWDSIGQVWHWQVNVLFGRDSNIFYSVISNTQQKFTDLYTVRVYILENVLVLCVDACSQCTLWRCVQCGCFYFWVGWSG